MKRPPLLLAGMSLAGAVVLVWFALLAPTQGGFGFDAYAFWDVHLEDIYGRSFGQLTAYGAFRYSPPIALLFAPLHALPWPVFLALWTGLLGTALAWLGGRWAIACCVFVGVPMSIYEGNIDLLVAASVVAGVQRPAALSFAILTKVTPAVVLVWFLVRRDWRSLWIAVGSTALMIGVTYPFVGGAWPRYVEMLGDNSRTGEASTVALRVLVAAAVAAWAAYAGRPWAVGVAAAVAQPALSLRSLAVGLAAVALRRRSTVAAPGSLGGPGRSGSRTGSERV